MAWTNPRTWVAGEIVTAALLNTHLRDNLLAVSGIWQNYTPGLVNWTGGSNTLAGRYCQIGKTVHFRASVTLGTGFGVSGTPGLTLPVTVGSGSAQILTAVLTDAGTSSYAAYAEFGTTTRVDVYAIGASGVTTALSSTVPFTWAVGDIIRVSGTYEAA